MQKALILTVAIAALLMHSSGSAEEKGTAYFDLGVFSYEEQNYTEALNHFKKAVEKNPVNPLFHQYLGKCCLKLERYSEAEYHLNIAWKKDPELPDAIYDLGMANLQLGNFSIAEIMFTEVLAREPENVLARYQLGIAAYKQNAYNQARDHFLKASDINSSVKPNAYYYAGICDLHTGNPDSAKKKFSWVAAHSKTADLRENAAKWLEIAKIRKKAAAPYSLTARLGFQYDTNVPLEPLDDDVYADKDDAGMEFSFSGKYHFFRRGNIILGAGYAHYQTLHYELSEYDIVGLTPSLYTIYDYTPFTISLSYLPTYYFLDTERYMLQHRINPEVIWKVRSNLYTRLSFSFYGNVHYLNEDRDGHTLEVITDVYYSMYEDRMILYGGIGYAKNSASHEGYDYGETRPFAGTVYRAPFELELGASLNFYIKAYDNEDTIYLAGRDDTEYDAVISLSRGIKWDWLAMSLEYRFSNNNSTIEEYEYTRNLVSLYCIARY